MALIVACCGAAFDRAHQAVSCDGIDWPRFLGLARFHRVQGLVREGVSRLELPTPEGVTASLSSEATMIAAENLRAIAESKALLHEFEGDSVPLLFLKGVTLSQLAYGNPALKGAADIDILIAREAIEKAARILRERDYRAAIPKGASDSAGLKSWHEVRKESLWLRDSDAIAIDLHTRVQDNADVIPAISVQSPRQTVDIGGNGLPTLAPDELFAYLCVHGASSAWFRLKWITDLAALLHPLPGAEIERLYLRSQELGAWRAADQALLLADRLYGSLEGTDLRDRLNGDRSSRRLFAAAEHQLISSREPTEVFLGTWRIHWTQFFLRPGAGFKLKELYRQVRQAIA